MTYPLPVTRTVLFLHQSFAIALPNFDHRLVSEAAQTDVRDNNIGENVRYGVYVDSNGRSRWLATRSGRTARA